MANSSLTVFDFKQNQVRVVLIDGEPWFVAKDLCVILEIKNVSDALNRLDGDEKNTIVLNDGNRGNPNTSVVSRSGMYALVLSSRKQEAKVFRKWITSEVLPSIEKTGSYTIASQQKQVKPHYIRRVEELMEQLPSVPDGYWCVLHKSVDVLFYVEHCLQMPVNQTDLLDGSIGRKWSDYRKGKPWAGDRVPFEYRFPDGRKVKPWCYGLHELGYFAQWLELEYRRNHLPKYLKAKYGAIVKV